MPLCNYFINGNCRFGSKCNNDHIDLKTLLRTEVDAVLNGKQWVLSCFGPFKESQVVPNFINDQSFEEVRMGFMENSKSGNVQQYLNSLISEYTSAVSKLNELKVPSPDTLQLIASIYNNSIDQKSPVLKPSMTQQKPNPFQSSNIFGAVSTSAQETTMSTSSIFGNSSSTNNPFQSNPMQQQQQQKQQPASIFGATNPLQQQASPFSFTPPTPQTSIFTQNIFTAAASQPQQQQPAVQASPSIFSNGIPSTNIFTQYGASAQQQPQQQQHLSTASGQAQMGSSIFAQSVFGQPLVPSSSPASSVFGAQATQNPFQQVQNSSTQSMNTATTNIFGAQQMAQPPQSMVQSVQPTNIFQIQQQPMQSESSPFGSNPFQQQSAPVEQNDASFYSRPEDITPEDTEAFQAEGFVYGKIPRVAPPKHLCV